MFFAFCPLIALSIFGVEDAVVRYIAIGVGALYLPMGLLALASAPRSATSPRSC